jgi:hypothetical protein
MRAVSTLLKALTMLALGARTWRRSASDSQAGGEFEHSFHGRLIGQRIGRVDQRLAGEVVDTRKLDHFFGDAAKDGENDDVAEPRGLCEGANLGPRRFGTPRLNVGGPWIARAEHDLIPVLQEPFSERSPDHA